MNQTRKNALCPCCKHTIGEYDKICPICGSRTGYGKRKTAQFLSLQVGGLLFLLLLYVLIQCSGPYGTFYSFYTQEGQLVSSLIGACFVLAAAIIAVCGFYHYQHIKELRNAAVVKARAKEGKELSHCLNGCRFCKSCERDTISGWPRVYCHWHLRDMDARVICSYYREELSDTVPEQSKTA